MESILSGFSRIEILEWNSVQFISLHPDEYGLGGSWNNLKIEFKDIDKNGTVDILLTEPENRTHDIWLQGHRRTYTKTYIWNGSEYALFNYENAQPDYRFEAIQDADSFTNRQEFEKALTLYLDSINNPALLSWSEATQFNFVQNIHVTEGNPTLTPPPSDPVEYPRLAAYAYYRIMLIYLAQGNEAEATTTYNTLLETFGDDPYAHPYVEMATAFWEAYQSTHKMYDGCAAAIQYAAEHPEILIPLGSDYHGWQSHTYVPEDVCPFR